jgi:isopentenyl-diphosphate delta-isomerase
MNEHVVLVDECDVVLGTAPKLETHHAETPLHRGFSVFLFNGRGELLMQQRSRHKKTWPLVWSNSCCGHPMVGERVVAAGARRLEYELGITAVELSVVLPWYRYRYEMAGVVENEICPVMVGVTDAPAEPNPAEVESVRWVAWRDFLGLVELDRSLSPWCRDEARLLDRQPLFYEVLRARAPIALAG